MCRNLHAVNKAAQSRLSVPDGRIHITPVITVMIIKLARIQIWIVPPFPGIITKQQTTVVDRDTPVLRQPVSPGGVFQDESPILSMAVVWEASV